MTKVIFSVVIPTYHRNSSLKHCLDRLEPGVQTLPADQYEVIITDDGIQSTAEMLIWEEYPWAKWVAGPHKGPAANRNNGAKHAQGDWLVFTDDDCLPSLEWLQAYEQAIVTNTNLVYEGKTTCNAGISSPMEQAPVNLHGGYLWSCNLAIKRDLFQVLCGFDENFPYPHMEDVDFRDRLSALQYSYLFVSHAIVDHPPRRIAFGVKLAKLHESDFYYYKKNQIVITTSKFFIGLLKTRTRNIFVNPLSIDTLKAVLSLAIELIYSFFQIGRWRCKYPVL